MNYKIDDLPELEMTMLSQMWSMPEDTMASSRELKFHGKHDYEVTVKSRGKNRGVTVEVRAGGELIGSDNASKVQFLYAVMTKGAKARELANQMDLMASYSKVAELAHRIEQREPEAIAIALCENDQAADLERNIQSGAYARMMRNQLKCTEECLDKVKRLLAGVFPQRYLLFAAKACSAHLRTLTRPKYTKYTINDNRMKKGRLHREVFLPSDSPSPA